MPPARSSSGSIQVVHDALVVTETTQRFLWFRYREGGQWTIPRALVRRADIYKRDLLTTDLICCDLLIERDGQTVRHTFHEEDPDWPILLGWLGGFEAFDRDWRSAVVKPAFAENRTTVLDLTFDRD